MKSTSNQPRNNIQSSPTRRRTCYDRHILKIDRHKYEISSSSSSSNHSSHKQLAYSTYLEEGLLQKSTVRQFSIERTQRKKKKTRQTNFRSRHITPVRYFRIAGWRDNYYSNLLDWTYSNFIVAANHSDLFFYNMTHEDQFQNTMYRKYTIYARNEPLACIKSSPIETKMALSYNCGTLKIYDYLAEKVVFSKVTHISRIGTIDWQLNNIITGSRDRTIKSFDPRTYGDNLIFPKYHQQQICGIKMHNFLVGSGGNDNNVFIYDIRKLDKKLDSYSHSAAVKAITWLPNDHTLATGGGTADKKIKFWKEAEGVYKEIDTGSQICSLTTSNNTNQLVSCQGFSLNQIIIWNSEGERQATIHGHCSRVLYSALSPCGQYLASGASDQALKVWRLFPDNERSKLLNFNSLR